MSSASEPRKSKPHKTPLDIAIAVLVGLCALLVAAELIVDSESAFAIEDIPGFYAMIGALVAGGLLRGIPLALDFLRRPEDYYDR